MINNFFLEFKFNQASPLGKLLHPAPDLRFSNDCNKLLFFGEWLGSFVPSLGVINRTNVIDKFPRLSASDACKLCQYSFGQFICIHVGKECVELFTSKTAPICYYTYNNSSLRVSVSLTNLRYSSQDISIDETTASLDQFLFYRDIFSTIVSNIQAIPGGFCLQLSGSDLQSYSYLSEAFSNVTEENNYSNYLNPFVQVLQASGLYPRLMLSGGVDSSFIALQLKKYYVNFSSVVFALGDGKSTSHQDLIASKEFFQSDCVSTNLDLDHRQKLIDCNHIDMLNCGNSSGWKWGYQYFSALPHDPRSPLISGLGDKILYLEHSSFDVFSTEYWLELAAGRDFFSFFMNPYKSLIHRLIYKNGFNQEDIIYASLGATSFPPPIKPSASPTELETLLFRRRTEDVEKMLLHKCSNINALRIISFYYYLAANIYPNRTNMCFPILDSIPFISNKLDALIDIVSPKNKELKEFGRYGFNYRRSVTFKYSYSRIKKSISRRFNKTPGSPGSNLLSRRLFYNSQEFRSFILSRLNNTSILIDTLPTSKLRDLNVRIFTSLKNGSEFNSDFPTSLVTFLRHEFFLRELLSE